MTSSPPVVSESGLQPNAGRTPFSAHQSLVDRLAGQSDEAALGAVGQLAVSESLRGADGVTLAASVADQLSQSVLPLRTQADRLRMLLARLALNVLGLEALAEVAQDFPPHLRNS